MIPCLLATHLLGLVRVQPVQDDDKDAQDEGSYSKKGVSCQVGLAKMRPHGID
jgi:hypothetical protein